MLKIKKWLVLLLALACLGILFACSKPGDSTDKEETPDPTDTEDVAAVQASASLECCDGEITLRFAKNDQDKWIWKDDETFPLDESYVAEMIATVEQMLTLTPLENPKELVDYDLDGDEEKYVVVSGKEGTITWYLGDKNDSGCYYMRRADQEGLVYLAPAQLTEQISLSIYDMAVLPELPTLTEESLISLRITDDQEQEITIAADASGNWMDNQGTDRSVTTAVLLRAFAQPKVAACVDYRPATGAATICGLKNPQATLHVEYINSLDGQATLTIYVGKEWKGGYYAKVNNDSTIYLLPAELVEPILSFID